MSLNIRLKHSSTVGKVPLPTDLVAGEVALNTADVKAYMLDAGGAVVQLAGAGADATKVDVAGDTMTGQLKLVGDPVADADAARKKYVDDQVAAGDFWSRTGTTLSPETAGDVVGFSAGTAALPGLTPAGDPNTGLYSPGTDQVAISTNGTGRLFVDESGNIGLNTTPETSIGRTVLSLDGINGDEIRLNAGGALTMTLIATGGFGVVRAREAGGYLRFDAGGETEHLRITSDGKVGVGTSAPGALVHAVNTSAGAATLGAVIQNADLAANTEVRLGFLPNPSIVSDNRYAYIGAINASGSTDNSLTFATGAGYPAIERMKIKPNGTINFSNVATYADNTAAKAGGLADGDVYRTATGQLMITFT